jgi:hypothetical protein
MENNLKCFICDKPLTGKQLRYCCHAHAQRWNNAKFHWRERKDRAARNAKKRAEYRADPEYWRNRQKAWRESHPEQAKIIARRASAKHPRSPWRRMIISAKQRAKAKNIPFDLTFDWGKATWTGFCALTKIPFADRSEATSGMFSPSLDRVIPEKGYVQDNCRFVLLCVNTFKNDGTDAAMYFIAEALLKNRDASISSASYPIEPGAADRLGANNIVADHDDALLTDLA